MAASVGHTRSAPTTGSIPIPNSSPPAQRWSPERPLSSINNPPMHMSWRPPTRLSDSQRDEIMQILRETPVRDLRQDIRSGDVLPSDVPPDLQRTGQKVRSLIRDRAAGRAFTRRMLDMVNKATAYSPYTQPEQREAAKGKMTAYLSERLPKMSLAALRSAMRSTALAAKLPHRVRTGSDRFADINKASAPLLRRALSRAYGFMA